MAKSIKRACIGVLFLLLVAVVWWAVSMDSLTKRRYVSRRISGYTERLRDDPADAEALNAILAYTESDYRFAATRATGSLGDVGPAAVSALPRLVELLDSKDGFIARAAAESLADLGPLSEPVISALEKKVAHGDPDTDVVWFCAEALGNIGCPAVDSLPLLRSKLGSGAVQFDDSLKAAIANLEKCQ